MNMNATAQMRTTTQVGCSRINWRKRYEDLEKSVLDLSHPNCKQLLSDMDTLKQKLEAARELLFAVQPFCEAWAAFDLADDIKGFLEGHPPRKERREKTKRPRKNKGA